MTPQMTSYLQLLVAIFAASSYGLVAKKFHAFSDIRKGELARRP
jgi:hypothetical protein